MEKQCKKPCSTDKICNTKSGRCVKIDGAIGKSIMGKLCPTGKIRNPKSGRCVNIAGKIGRSIQDIQYIVGPCSFYHFKHGARNIYLFGECHLPLERSIKPDNVIMFADFIKFLVTEHKKTNYDLMFESRDFLTNESTDAIRRSTSPTFDSLIDKFYNCLIPMYRKNCKYRNLRIHYINFRKSAEGLCITEKTFTDDVKKLLHTGKVSKQLKSIKDQNTVNLLSKYLLDNSKYVNRHNPIVMDIYGLSRILRDFDNKDNNQFTGTSNNVIYYAGIEHVKNMVTFFTKYMGLVPIQSVPTPSSCSKCASFLKLDVNYFK